MLAGQQPPGAARLHPARDGHRPARARGLDTLRRQRQLVDERVGGGVGTGCAHCPGVAMDGLENTLAVLEDDNGGGQEIFVDPALAAKAMKPLDRMLEFGARLKP